MDSPNKYYSLVAHNTPLVIATLTQIEYDAMTLYYKKKSIDVSQRFGSVITDLIEDSNEHSEESMTNVVLASCHDIEVDHDTVLCQRPLALEQLKHMRGVLSVVIEWSAKGLKERFVIELDDTHVRVLTIHNGEYHYRRSKREEWCGRLLTYSQASKDMQLRTRRLWGYESDAQIDQACRVLGVTYVRVL